MTNRDQDEARATVREHYAKVAATDGACGCGPGCCGGSRPGDSIDLGYRPEELASVPEGANMGLGCGTPLAFAALREGEIVLDLGSGGGLDSFLAAKQVGPAGRVIGVDMTPEMVEKARRNAEKVEAHNVEFRLGEIERLPLPDRSVDVVVSNCVVNLSPNKSAVFEDAFRVLRPGGRIAISDIVASAALPPELAAKALSGCVAGAPVVEDLRAMIEGAGFVDVEIDLRPESRAFIRNWIPGSAVESYVASAVIKAVRPVGTGCCGTDSGSSCC